MIVYKDIIGKLKSAGYNSSRIRKENLLPQSTLQRLRDGDLITLESIDKICELTGCRIEEIIEYRKEGNMEKGLDD